MHLEANCLTLEFVEQCARYQNFCRPIGSGVADQNDDPLIGFFTGAQSRSVLFLAFTHVILFVLQLTVHEIFHVLGFSCSLFDQFRDCTYSGKNINVIILSSKEMKIKS